MLLAMVARNVNGAPFPVLGLKQMRQMKPTSLLYCNKEQEQSVKERIAFNKKNGKSSSTKTEDTTARAFSSWKPAAAIVI